MIPTLKTLGRRDALLALNVHRFVQQELHVDLTGSTLLVAFSGGLDSTALLYLLVALREYGQFRLAAAHLDHALRPESGQDAAFCARFCQSLDVPFLSVQIDVRQLAEQSGVGLEEAGRDARYAFLEQSRQGSGADWIVTAHHADDLAEDVLLRLVRGAAWPGLGGMRALDLERHLLRPLLMQDKETLRSFLLCNAVPWVEDASNTTREFRRNRIRLDVLPLLRKENPSFLHSIRNLWSAARADEAYWSEITASLPQWTEQGIFLADTSLLPLPHAGRLRAYVAALRLLDSSARYSSLSILDATWLKKKRGRIIQFSHASASITPVGILFSTAHCSKK